ncbi:MAG: hypothetical protein MMC23_006656 [Stictis urceolatum]|nr:hypothetical protein [Stictis urceolata]
MKYSQIFTAALSMLGTPVLAAPSNFAGSNLYYAAGLTEDQQTTLFTGLQSAGVKVLRVWLDGQSGQPKGTAIQAYGSLEGDTPESWDDTVLNRYDDFMVNANKYGIKLLISIHSYNALSGNSDFYGKTYGTGDFYTSDQAKDQFKQRISHVLDHTNPSTNKKWSDSSEYIFAFEAQNEAMHDQENPSALTQWQCEMAEAIRGGLASNDTLVTTGGGAWLDNSLLDAYFTCDALDIVAAHAYGTGDFDTDKIKGYVQKATESGKKLIMQEWGACYFSSDNNRCDNTGALDSATRDSNLKKWYSSIAEAGIAPFYWQILPNEDPHSDWDYEVGIGGVNWDALKEASAGVNQTESAFDWSGYLL